MTTIAYLCAGIPHWLIWPWLIIGLFVSAFFAWRDESREVARLRSKLDERPLTRLQLRDRIEMLTKTGLNLCNLLTKPEGAVEISNAKQWLAEVDTFTVAHLSLSEADIIRSYKISPFATFNLEITRLEPHREIEAVRSEVCKTAQSMVKLRDFIK